jgi:hypothetical protein
MSTRRRRNGNGHNEQLKASVNNKLQGSMAQDRDQFQAGKLNRDEYLEKLTGHGLNERSASMIDNLLSPDFVMSNISGAEKDEIKWLVRLEAEKIKAMHPPTNSPVSGARRAVLYDDDEADLKPLSDKDKMMLETAVWDIFFRVARSVNGWQQEELSSQYNVSKVESGDDDDGGRLGGLFS